LLIVLWLLLLVAVAVAATSICTSKVSASPHSHEVVEVLEPEPAQLLLFIEL
jgi:hypothetical protein